MMSSNRHIFMANPHSFVWTLCRIDYAHHFCRVCDAVYFFGLISISNPICLQLFSVLVTIFAKMLLSKSLHHFPLMQVSSKFDRMQDRKMAIQSKFQSIIFQMKSKMCDKFVENKMVLLHIENDGFCWWRLWPPDPMWMSFRSKLLNSSTAIQCVMVRLIASKFDQLYWGCWNRKKWITLTSNSLFAVESNMVKGRFS